MSVVLKGAVQKKIVAPGSKSERRAVVLESPDGDFLLRRVGGNPFTDPELEALVGQVLEFSGSLHGQYFFVTGWTSSADPD